MKRIVSSRYGIAMLCIAMLGSFTAEAAPRAPTITSWSDGKYVNQVQQTVAGGCRTGNSVRVFGNIAGSSISLKCTANRYSSAITLTAGDGAKAIRVTQSDASGTSPQVSRSLNLDQTAPAAPVVTSPAEGATVTSANITVRGPCENAGRVSLAGNIVTNVTTACVSGAFSQAVQLKPGNGVKTITLRQRDRANNASEVTRRKITLNTASTPLGAPTIAAPSADAYVRVLAQTVSGSCQSGATVNINGSIQSAPQTVVCSNGSYSRSVNLSAGDGAKTIRVSQSASSLTSAEVSRSLNLDTIAPSAPSVTSPSSGATVTNASINVVGACESNAVVSLSGAIESSPQTVTCANSAYSISASLTAGNGSKALSVSQRDRAGNVSAARSLTLNLSGTTNPNPGLLTIFDCHSNNFVIATSNSRVPCAVAGPSGWVSPIGFAIPGSFVAESSIENGTVYLSRDYDNGGHLGTNMIYQTPVNTRAFEATFTFVPSGKNIAFVLQNSTNSVSGFNGKHFDSGAGCEAGFFQAYSPPEEGAVNNIFALALMQDMPLLSVNDSWDNDYFTHSSAMIYKTGESPCSYMPTPHWANRTPFSIPTKISTSPVSLNAPANVPLTSTGQNYEAKISYDGSNVTLNLRNLTTGGVCPGANCFTQTWRNVKIPALVGGNTAWVSLSAGCNSDCARRVQVNSFKYAAPAN